MRKITLAAVAAAIIGTIALAQVPPGGGGGGGGGGGAITAPLGSSTSDAASVAVTFGGTPPTGFVLGNVCAGAVGAQGYWGCMITQMQSGVGTAGSAYSSTGTGLMVGGYDGTNYRFQKVDSNGNQTPNQPSNVTPNSCSGTITVGGTAQNAFAASSNKHGFMIRNTDPSSGGANGEPLLISWTSTASPTSADSAALAAPTSSTTLAGGDSFTSPPGWGINTALSVYGATTGHKYFCSWE